MSKNTNGRPGVPPMVPSPPNAPDRSFQTPEEIVGDEMASRERLDRMHSDHVRGDERGGRGEFERDENIGRARGGDRAFSNEDWSRAAMPTDPERRRMIQEWLRANLLPRLPTKPGVHRFWASKDHKSDTPRRRLQLGYRYITYEDVRSEGWDQDLFGIKDAEQLSGQTVEWREMIAMEIPLDMWHELMRELHHDQPIDQARGIYEALDAAGAEARDRGGRTTLEPGMEELRRRERPPRQFEG